MKKTVYLFCVTLLTLTFFNGCKNDVDSKDNGTDCEMTADEKENAKKEISDVGKFVLENAAKLDVETALKPYSNDPEFLLINPDGSYSDYGKMKETNIEAFKQLSSFKQTTLKEEYRFLTKKDVLYTWYGKNEIQLKTGEKITNESYIGTMLFKKINNDWTIVYAHESASPSIQVEDKK